MITVKRMYSEHRQAATFAAGAVSILVLALGWWLASPLFISNTVDEDFPLAAGAVIPEGVTMADAETTMATLAKMDEEQQEAMSPVAIASGSNIIRVEVVAADGTRVTRELAVTGGN